MEALVLELNVLEFFNHKSFKTVIDEKFFTKEYETILESSRKTECSGNTNYEEALKDGISDFKGRGLRNKHILFITDGIPTSGDTEVRAEIQRAKRLGICIHSIFIYVHGKSESEICPCYQTMSV